jgi:hypothetical protein
MKEWKNLAIFVVTDTVLVLGAILLWLAYVPLVIILIFMICIVLVNAFLGVYLELRDERKSEDARESKINCSAVDNTIKE